IRSDRTKLYRIHVECVRRNSRYGMEYDKMEGLKKLSRKNKAFIPFKALRTSWGLRQNEAAPNPRDRPALDGIAAAQVGSRTHNYLPGDLTIDARSWEVIDEVSFLGLNLNPTVMAGMLVLLYSQKDSPPHPRRTVLDTRWSKK